MGGKIVADEVTGALTLFAGLNAIQMELGYLGCYNFDSGIKP
jgi:hypothetical protein